MEGQKHPRESEALRPKVVEALKEVRMRKIMTKNDNEKQEEERRQTAVEPRPEIHVRRTQVHLDLPFTRMEFTNG